MSDIIKWEDKELSITAENTIGRLNKVWVKDMNTDKVYLVKGTGWFGYEPFSERLAYIVGKHMGIDVLEYKLIPMELFKGVLPKGKNCKYLSICEKLGDRDSQIVSIADIKKERNAMLKEGEEPITNRSIMYEVMSQEYIDKMLLFDAIIGNTDRHFGNIHVLRNVNGELKEAPIIDNGASLLATEYYPNIVLAGSNVGESLNKSYTLAKNHDLQMKFVHDLTNLKFNVPELKKQIFESMEPVFELMPKQRVKAIKMFIDYRLDKYLELIKVANNEPNPYKK